MGQSKATLCWRCANACGKCSWSANFQPVKGWRARKTIIKADKYEQWHKEISSYIVYDCPLFEDDTAQYKTSYQITVPYKSPNKGHKSPMRKQIEALPSEELERLFEKAKVDAFIARMAFIEKMTSTEIALIVHRCEDTVKKRICEMVRKIAEVAA